jgi:periplasmic protein TonB
VTLLLALVAAAQPTPSLPQPETAARHIGGYVSDADYPRRLGRRGVGGTTAVRFLVGERGRVTSCEVSVSSGSVELDRIVCNVVQRRFRYEPARDARRRPVGQWRTLTWRWIPPGSISINTDAAEHNR